MLFFGILIFLVLVYVRPQDFIPMYMGKGLVAITMGVVGVGWILSSVVRKNEPKIKIPQHALMIAFWFAIVISTLAVHYLTFTFNTFIEWGKNVLIFILMASIINTPKRIKIVVWTIVICMTITAVIGIMQYFGNDITGVGIREFGRIRGVGIFDTNQLAYTLAFISPLIWGLFCMTRAAFVKIILISIFTSLYFAIYATNSRGGLLCAAAVKGLIVIMSTKKKTVKILVIIINS